MTHVLVAVERNLNIVVWGSKGWVFNLGGYLRCILLIKRMCCSYRAYYIMIK